MKRSKSNLALALVLLVGASGMSAQAEAAQAKCGLSLEQYTSYARQLAAFASRARQQADTNPIYESDAQYYAAELADVQQCIKTLASIATALQ